MIGEGTGDHLRTQKDKVCEGGKMQPGQHVSSQKDTVVNKESNTLLFTSSQKDVNFGNISQPGALNTGEGTQIQKIATYVRKNKGSKDIRALGEHTLAQQKAVNFDVEPSMSDLDASQAKY